MKLYYYLFYKLYKFWETAPARFWSEWKASLSIVILQIWFVASLFVYYKVFVNNYYQFNKNLFILLGITLFVINYYTFHYNDKWKNKVEEFNKLPKNKNFFGGIIVWSIIAIIICIILLSFYLMSQVDWNQSI